MNTESVRKKITYHFYPCKYSMATTNERMVFTQQLQHMHTNIYAEITVFDKFLHFLLDIHHTGN